MTLEALPRSIHIRDFLVGLLTAVLCFTPVAAFLIQLKETPYTDVKIESVEFTESEIIVVSTFNKNDMCKYVALGVFGGNLGQWSPLEWRDVETPQGDRFAGLNTLRMRILPQGNPYQTIEIRTRHDCDGVKVDKIFATIDID